MSGSVNKVTILGKLGKDPESMTFANGGGCTKFSVATSESWKNKTTGEKQEKTEWHNVVIFNEHLAKIADDYLKKGSAVYLEGAIQTRKWQDQSGTDRYSTEIVLQKFKGELTLLDGPATAGDKGGARANHRDAGPRKGAFGSGSGGYADDLDDDVPFIHMGYGREPGQSRRRV